MLYPAELPARDEGRIIGTSMGYLQFLCNRLELDQGFLARSTVSSAVSPHTTMSGVLAHASFSHLSDHDLKRWHRC